MKTSLSILMRAALAGLLLAQLTGCATIVKGHSQQINVVTKPPGAVCDLQRDGGSIASVNPTPGTATVEKSRKEIAVHCTKPGYQPGNGTVASKFHPMTFGNILFGGIIGIGVDAMSGAMTEYDDNVTIRLMPEEFATVTERDAYFDSLRDEVSAQSNKAMEEVAKHCTGQADCDKKRSLAEKGRDNALSEIETQRANAKIRAS